MRVQSVVPEKRQLFASGIHFASEKTMNINKGLLAYSHHDRFPPWWVFVRDDNGGNLSGDKIPP